MKERRKGERVERAILAVALSVLGGYMGWSLYAGHVRIENEERERLTLQAKVIDDNLGRQLTGIDSALTSIRRDLPYLNDHNEDGTRLNRRLKFLSDAMPGVRTLQILDRQGVVVATTKDSLAGLNFAWREYFLTAHQHNDPNALQVTPPFETVPVGAFGINLVRTITDSQGGFAGLVTATLDSVYFSTLLSSVIFASDMRVGMIHGDGIQFVFYPPHDGHEGRNLAQPGSFFALHQASGRTANVFTGTTYATGERRMIAFRTIAPGYLPMDKPLIVAVSRDLDAIFEAWSQDARIQSRWFGLLVAVACLGLIGHQRRQRELAVLADRSDAERRQSDIALRDSEQRWQFALEGAGDGVWDRNLETGIIYYSRRCSEMLGYEDGELNTDFEEWQKSVHPEDLEAAMAAIRAHLDGETPQYAVEYRLKCKDGRWKWLLSRGIVVSRADDGKPLRIIGTRSDISRHKQAEKELKSSGDFKQAVLDSVSSNIAVIDANGIIVAVNSRWKDFAQQYGHQANTDVGTNYLQICRDSTGEGADEAVRVHDGIGSVLRGRVNHFSMEYSCPAEDQQLWFLMNVTPLGSVDQGVVVSHTDITERKQIEQRMERVLAEQKAMLDNELIGIVMVSNRLIVWANPAFEKLLGYAPGELIGVSTRQNYPSEEAYREFGLAAYPVLTSGQVFRTQIEHIRKDGKHIWTDVSGAVLDREAGTSLWGFIDITERKALELGLRQTNADLEQFAYVASHDLRQPLRMVSNYLDLIQKRLGPQLGDDLRTYFGFAIGGAKRMDRLINDLLEYSRTGRTAGSQPVALDQAVGDAIFNLTEAIIQSKARVSVPDQLPTIIGDLTEITRLFQNLIGNAIKYQVPDRTPEIVLEWTRKADHYLISVTDNGMGIAPEHQERAFLIFQRLVPREAYEGSGIGLAVCKKIVEHCGGKIWIESQVGLSCSFFMTFPIPPDEAWEIG